MTTLEPVTPFLPHEIKTADGQVIVARFFVPGEDPIGTVLIVPAMGAKQD